MTDDKFKVETFEGDIAEMAAESDADRRDHARLARDLEWILKHEGAMRIPMATRRLVDQGVDALVLAKELLIGDRDGGPMYTMTSRAVALDQHEHGARVMYAIARSECPVEIVALQMAAGAVWLAEQFQLSRQTLRDLVVEAPRRARVQITTQGCGVVDIVDNLGVRDRAWLLDAIDHAQLPMFAPLEYKR